MSTAVHYDEHQFAYRHQQQAVQVDYGAGGVARSTGISFEDYTRMSTHLSHKPCRGRKMETPVWALNDAKLRAVLVRSLELRAHLNAPQQGTEQERLDRAQRALQAANAALVDRLKNLASQYVQLKAAPDAAGHLAALRVQIENVDTMIRTSADWAATALGIVYRYYRLGEDSVSVAIALNIKPPHVRQTLWRLNNTWDEMQGCLKRHRPATTKKPKPPKLPLVCDVCGCEYQHTYTGRPSPFCVPCRRIIKKIQHRLRKRKPPARLCSPECRAIYKDQHKLHPVVPAEQFGHEMEVARASGDSPSYRAYLAGCARVGVKPMLHDQWICSVEYMLGQYGLIG